MSGLDDILNEINNNPAGGGNEPPKQEAPLPPRPGSLDDILGQINANPRPEDPKKITAETPWSDVLTEGAKNFIPDIGTTAVDIGSGLYNTIRHPIDSAGALASIGKGTYDYFRGNKTPEAEVAKGLGNQLLHE